jgi:hypothetical protein
MIGRARWISLAFVQREPLARLSRDARLLYYNLVTISDDYGRTVGSPLVLAGQLYPLDLEARARMPDWIMELVRAGEVWIYEVRGQTYLQLLAFDELTRPDRRVGAQHPCPPLPPLAVQRELPLHTVLPPRKPPAVAK